MIVAAAQITPAEWAILAASVLALPVYVQRVVRAPAADRPALATPVDAVWPVPTALIFFALNMLLIGCEGSLRRPRNWRQRSKAAAHTLPINPDTMPDTTPATSPVDE